MKKKHTKNTWASRREMKQSFFSRKSVVIALSIVMFLVSMYSVRCGVTKVCGAIAIDKVVRSTFTVLMPKGALDVEVVNTPASRELGLSGRTSMRDDEGMLFVFDTPMRYGFWMKDMNFPLDIIWINEDGIVVSIERNLSRETYPKVFMNQSNALYVLEMNAGMAEKFGLYLGSKVKITE